MRQDSPPWWILSAFIFSGISYATPVPATRSGGSTVGIAYTAGPSSNRKKSLLLTFSIVGGLVVLGIICYILYRIIRRRKKSRNEGTMQTLDTKELGIRPQTRSIMNFGFWPGNPDPTAEHATLVSQEDEQLPPSRNGTGSFIPSPQYPPPLPEK